jgi:hypothetical protein
MTEAERDDELQRLRRATRDLIRAGLNLTAYVEGICARGGGTKSAMRELAGEFVRVADEARTNRGASCRGQPLPE